MRRPFVVALLLLPWTTLAGCSSAPGGFGPKPDLAEADSGAGRADADGVDAAGPDADQAADGDGGDADRADAGQSDTSSAGASGADADQADAGRAEAGRSTDGSKLEAGSEAAAADGGLGGVPIDPALRPQCTGSSPVVCAFPVTDGNYDVTVQLGSPGAAAVTRVEAETRRIVLQPARTGAGMLTSFTFAVNVRQEVHDGYGAPAGILNLVFDGAAPAVQGIGIARANIPTIFVAGDSTVCDWDPPAYNPFASLGATDVTGWAQELSQYLDPGVAVANYADSGETAGTFYTKFFPPAQAAMKQGDYLFVQFGHNDQKTDTSTTYRANLSRYITDARAKGVTPVLVTPVARSSGANFVATDGVALDQTMRDLAASDGVALVDLTNLSLAYYATLSGAAKTALFIDGTHLHEPAATQIALLVAQALANMTIGLQGHVR